MAAALVAAPDIGQPQSAAEYRFHVSALVRFGARALHVRGHTGVAGEVFVDVEFRGRIFYSQIARKPIRAHAVNQTEVDYFGVAALLA